MPKYEVIHDFWDQGKHRFFFKGQKITVETDRAQALLAVHPSTGTPLIKEAATPKRTAKKKEEVTSDETVSDGK